MTLTLVPVPRTDPFARPRPEWDRYFAEMSQSVAQRGTCNRLKVGCIIVQGNHPVAMGYNGSPRGLAHCLDEGCLVTEEGRCVRTIHAEMNAIMRCRESTQGATCYVTHEPCEMCTKLLIQAGIVRVVYIERYGNPELNPFRIHLSWEPASL